MANRRLRVRLHEEADARGVALYLPAMEYCTDNGAMIAAAAAFRLGRGERDDWAVDVDPGLGLGT